MIKAETKVFLQKAIDSELSNCIENHGERYNTSNEFYGVLLEEIVELNDEFKKLKKYKKKIFKKIKKNKNYEHQLIKLSSTMLDLLSEASQVAAVVEKEIG